MREHNINNLDNFICGWYMDDTSLCDDVIQYHQSQPQHHGVVLGGYKPNIKDSYDCWLTDENLLKRYGNVLQNCVDQYIKKYKWCNEYAPWGLTQKPNVQRYEPKAAFHAWHTERPNAQLPAVSRHLVFITYLNDITDGGETEFYHQKVKVKPEKGLTLLWGSDWTFTHRGLPSQSETKYVITGWFNFIE